MLEQQAEQEQFDLGNILSLSPYDLSQQMQKRLQDEWFMTQFLEIYGNSPDLRKEMKSQVSEGFDSEYIDHLFRLYPSSNLQPFFRFNSAALSSVFVFLGALTIGIYFYETLWTSDRYSPGSWLYFSAPILLITLLPFLLTTNVLRPFQTRRLKQKIEQAAQKPPNTQFIIHFAEHQAKEVVDQFKETLHTDIQELQTKLNEQQSDLREAKRLYQGELQTPMYQTLEKTLLNRCNTLETEICRMTYMSTRLEDLKDQLHQQVHSVQTKQKQKAHFDKVMQNETDETIEMMKRQQEENMLEMEDSLRALLRLMSDANYYLDAVKEVDGASMPLSSLDDT